METIRKWINTYYGWNDIEKEPPAGGIRRVIYILLNYPGRIFLANLFFLIGCIPIVTIPASYMALDHYLLKIYQKGYGFSNADYWKEFGASCIRRLPLGLMTGFLCFYGYYLMSLAGNFADARLGAMVTGIGLAVTAAGLLVGSYSFLLSAMLELPNGALLKNTGILILAEWKASIGVLMVLVVTMGLILALAPYSLFLILAGLIAVQQVCICAILYPVVQRRIVGPYERARAGK